MKKLHTWNTQSGLKVEVTAELILSNTVWCDGDEVTVPDCRIETTVTLEGRGSLGSIVPVARTISGVTYPAYAGPLMISDENYSAIKQMEKELKETPEWIAKMKKAAAAAAEAEKYEAGAAMMAKVMG